jgi:hypothetical protein
VTLPLAFPCSEPGNWVSELLLFTSSDICLGPNTGAHRARGVAWGGVMDVGLIAAYAALGVSVFSTNSMYPFATIYTLWVLVSAVIGLTVYLTHRKT